MAKDPAFLFYSQDFLAGTQFFTHEQVGKYIRLMIAQHIHGHLPEKHMLMICGSHDEDIFAKFIKDERGLFFNQRLEDVVEKRKAYSASRANNRRGAKSSEDDGNEVITVPNQPTNLNNISETYVKHMENENENENRIKNASEVLKEKAENFKIDCDVYIDEYGEELVKKFVSYWTEAGAKARKLRWEKEPVFDVKRRLDTFRDNQKQWSAGKKQTGAVGPSKVAAATERHKSVLDKYKDK